jgi:2-polyprenyl-3-methyl-5-hydroxy-6-metoxy-1,4-benzoquinol methylase
MTENHVESKIEVEHLLSAGVPASLLEYLHACPVCFGQELRHYCRVPSLFNPREYIHYERCRGCGTALRNPRLPAGYRRMRYEDGELREEQTRLTLKSQVHYAYMIRLIERLRHPGDGRRLLDFGCGSGGFLLAAREAGFDVMGLELSRGLARYVEEIHGIRVHQGLVTDPTFAHERFDVILTSQVFEHLLDPRESLRELRRHCNPQGLILIEVPNLFDTRERLRRGAMMDDSHLFYFSASSLSGLLRAEGFNVLKVQQGLRPYRFLTRPRPRVPDWLLDWGERVLSACQLRTNLSVIARRNESS